MKQMKSLNSFLAQNVLKLTSVHSFEWAKRVREIINTFQVVKIPATTHILSQNYKIPWLFPRLSCYLKFPWPICKIPRLFPDLEEKSHFPDFSLTCGHPDWWHSHLYCYSLPLLTYSLLYCYLLSLLMYSHLYCYSLSLLAYSRLYCYSLPWLTVTFVLLLTFILDINVRTTAHFHCWHSHLYH